MVHVAALALVAVLAAPEADAAKTYRIETEGSTARLAVGAPGKLVLAIQPLGNVHVHPQAPLKITVESSKGLRVEKAQLLRKDAVDPKAAAPRFEVPFAALEPGKQEARAKIDFFVCSDQWCVKQVKDVAVPVTVTAR